MLETSADICLWLFSFSFKKVGWGEPHTTYFKISQLLKVKRCFVQDFLCLPTFQKLFQFFRHDFIGELQFLLKCEHHSPPGR